MQMMCTSMSLYRIIMYEKHRYWDYNFWQKVHIKPCILYAIGCNLISLRYLPTVYLLLFSSQYIFSEFVLLIRHV